MLHLRSTSTAGQLFSSTSTPPPILSGAEWLQIGGVERSSAGAEETAIPTSSSRVVAGLSVKMASSTVMSRLSSTRLPSFSLKLKTIKSTLFTISPSSSQCQVFSLVKRISLVSRLPVELSCVFSMMPLHSTIASARFKSLLSIESQSWGLVPQGISMPL